MPPRPSKKNAGSNPLNLDTARRPLPVEPPSEALATVEGLLAHFGELETQLAQVRESLTHSHRLATLGTIATIIAHEYNNILTPVVSYAQLSLANPADGELMKKAVEKALLGAEKAASISAALLGFAREADGRHVAQLSTTIEDAIKCLARRPEKDGIELTVDVPGNGGSLGGVGPDEQQRHPASRDREGADDNLVAKATESAYFVRGSCWTKSKCADLGTSGGGITVAISPLNLEQVLVNLLLNAKAAMPRGGSIRISAEVRANIVHLWVADSGPGIPQGIRDRVFEPFVTQRVGGMCVNGDASSVREVSSDQKGTGLGLSICRDLIRQAGGDIDFTTATGQGTTFHITLPKAPDIFVKS